MEDVTVVSWEFDYGYCTGIDLLFLANDLIELKGAFSVANSIEAQSICDQLIQDEDFRMNASKNCVAFMKTKQGATDVIMNYLAEQNGR